MDVASSSPPSAQVTMSKSLDWLGSEVIFHQGDLNLDMCLIGQGSGLASKLRVESALTPLSSALSMSHTPREIQVRISSSMLINLNVVFNLSPWCDLCHPCDSLKEGMCGGRSRPRGDVKMLSLVPRLSRRCKFGHPFSVAWVVHLPRS